MNKSQETEYAREYRNSHQCGLLEAKRQARKTVLLQAIEQAQTVEDLKPVLQRLINND